MPFKMKSPFKLMGNKRKAKKSLQKQYNKAKEASAEKQRIMRYGDKESGFSERSIEKMGAVAYANRKKYGKRRIGELDKKAISKRKVTPKVYK